MDADTFIYRITHIKNLRWYLENGISSMMNDGGQNPNFVAIGHVDIIKNRISKIVETPSGGSLKDYVPFYFGKRSPMLFNIQRGFGVPHVSPEDIVYLVSSLSQLNKLGLNWVFTDMNAASHLAQFYEAENKDALASLDWPAINATIWRDKKNEKQAECLVHKFLPASAILGICTYSEAAKTRIM